MAEINIFIGETNKFSGTDKLPKYVCDNIKKQSNTSVIAEKKASYGLLDYGLKQMNTVADVTECFLSETEKPMHRDFYFSISHKSGIVAVAISENPIGIDVESKENKARTDRLKKKILHESETDENTLVLWTIKEAIFKLKGTEKIFIPSSIDTTKANAKTFDFKCNKREYIISVAAGKLTDIRFYNADTNEILNI